MKTRNYLLLAAVAVLTTNYPAWAGEPVLSPRVAQLRHELRKVPSAPSPDLTKDRPIGNAKAWALIRDFRKIPGVSRDIDLAHAPRPAFSPKDPHFEMVWRQTAEQRFQVAPLKPSREEGK